MCDAVCCFIGLLLRLCVHSITRKVVDGSERTESRQFWGNGRSLFIFIFITHIHMGQTEEVPTGQILDL